MNARGLFLALVVLLVGAFAWLNMSAIMEPTEVNLMFTTVQAPLGMILLAILGTLVILFLLYMLYLQSKFLLESRNLHKELDAQRKLADEAEASRLAELKTSVAEQFDALKQRDDDDKFQVMGRIDRLEDGLRETLGAENTDGLRTFVADEIAKIEKRDGDANFQVMARMDRLEESLSNALSQKVVAPAAATLISDTPDTPSAT